MLRVETIDNPTDDMRETINAVLRNHNATASPDFWQALDDPSNDPVAVHLFAFDDDRIVGGLFGST